MSERHSVKHRLKKYLITGILVTVPIVFTIFFLKFLLDILRNVLPFQDFFEFLGLGSLYGWSLFSPLLSLLLLVWILIAVGILSTNVIGGRMVAWWERLLQRVPLVRNIYTAVKQLLETIFASGSRAFRQVVLLEYPRHGLYSIGFMTCENQDEIQALTEEAVVNVFVPTTPNPTSGFLLMVPKKDIVLLKMTVEEAFKLIMSGGIVTSGHTIPFTQTLGDIKAHQKGHES